MATQRAHAPLRLPLRDAIERIRADVALDDFSHLNGVSALVIDLEGERAAPPNAAAQAATRIRELACPTIGVRPASSASQANAEPAIPSDVLERELDLIVSDELDLETVLEAVARRPIASLALVQLLRIGDQLDVHEALIAESLVYSTLQSGPEFAAWLASRPPAGTVAPQAHPPVLVTREQDVLELVLNRPDRRNAYSAAMRDALVEALQTAVAEPSIRHIELRGRGASFCSGGDLAEFGTHPDPATSHAIRSTRSAARLLARCGSRVWATVHGVCVGAGVELPAFAARVLARPNSLFTLPEVSMGLVPGAGGTASIPRRIGRQRTAWMALSGARVDAETALAWGLVDEIVRTDAI